MTRSKRPSISKKTAHQRGGRWPFGSKKNSPKMNANANAVRKNLPRVLANPGPQVMLQTYPGAASLRDAVDRAHRELAGQQRLLDENYHALWRVTTENICDRDWCDHEGKERWLADWGVNEARNALYLPARWTKNPVYVNDPIKVRRLLERLIANLRPAILLYPPTRSQSPRASPKPLPRPPSMKPRQQYQQLQLQQQYRPVRDINRLASGPTPYGKMPAPTRPNPELP